MVARRRKGNPELVRLLVELKRAARSGSAPVWAAVADRLERPRHRQLPINVGHLQRLAAPGETVAIAGKLLAEGRIAKRLTVGAFGFSAEAREKIQAAGGSAVSLRELVKAHPDGSGVRFLA
jgi:large subunit ribosomal protein L18e